MPIQFVLLANFHKQMLLPGELLSMYVHQLKQLLNQAMPDIPAAAKEQLLFYQFLSRLPQEVSKQFRATGTATTLTDAVEQAKLLMTIEHREVAAITKQPDCNNSFLIYQKKWRQCLFAHLGSIKDMWKYEDALFATKQDTFSMLVLPNVQDKMHDNALNATNLVIYGKIVRRERGGCMGQQPSQQSLSPQAVTMATTKNKATVIMGNAFVEIMFDSGSAVSLLRKRDMEHMKSLQHMDKHP